MSSHSWLDVWKLFLDVVSRESIVMQIAIGLGAAFIAVMALEGIRASFFPRRIAAGVALRDAMPPPQPALSAAPPPSIAPVQEEDMRAAVWNPVADLESIVRSPLPRAVVNAEFARRSSPAQMRVIGQRKPS